MRLFNQRMVQLVTYNEDSGDLEIPSGFVRHKRTKLQKLLVQMFNSSYGNPNYKYKLNADYYGNSTATNEGFVKRQFSDNSQNIVDTNMAYSFSLVIIIAAIFLCFTVAATVAVLIFCSKRNSVFSSSRNKQNNSNYELSDMTYTDGEYTTDYETETEFETRPSPSVSVLPDSDYDDDTPCHTPLVPNVENDSPGGALYGATGRPPSEHTLVSVLIDAHDSDIDDNVYTMKSDMRKSKSYDAKLMTTLHSQEYSDSIETLHHNDDTEYDSLVLGNQSRSAHPQNMNNWASTMANRLKKSFSFDSRIKYKTLNN